MKCRFFMKVALTAACACIPFPVLAGDGASTAPVPAPSASPVIDIEVGTAPSSLSNGKPSWSQESLRASLKTANERSLYALASHDDRYLQSDNRYEIGLALPMDSPRGSLALFGAFSPQHHFLARDEFGATSDLRAGGGFGYQIGYTTRSYPADSVNLFLLGTDRYYGLHRFAYAITLATLTNVPGIAFSQALRWTLYGSRDALSIAGAAGRDVENTGLDNTLAVYRSQTLDVDELHWFNPTTALHFGAEYSGLAPHAYNRFEVRLGIRKRI